MNVGAVFWDIVPYVSIAMGRRSITWFDLVRLADGRSRLVGGQAAPVRQPPAQRSSHDQSCERPEKRTDLSYPHDLRRYVPVCRRRSKLGTAHRTWLGSSRWTGPSSGLPTCSSRFAPQQ